MNERDLSFHNCTCSQALFATKDAPEKRILTHLESLLPFTCQRKPLIVASGCDLQYFERAYSLMQGGDLYASE